MKAILTYPVVDDATQSSADEMSCSYDDQTGLDEDKHHKRCVSSSDIPGNTAVRLWEKNLLWFIATHKALFSSKKC